MRHSIHFNLTGETAAQIHDAANVVATHFFGDGPHSMDITTKRSANSQSLWEASVVVTQRQVAPKPTRKHLSAGTTFEVYGPTLAELVARADERLNELYGDEEFTYTMTIEPHRNTWKASVSAWLGGYDTMGDF